jgi:N-acetylglutamate synthase-like GNAT family acetyltransferase
MIPKFGAMSLPQYRVRRATLEDVSALAALWVSMRFPAEDLARRVTEFQVAEGPDGVVAGAIGLQMIGKQGQVHSEAFTDFALADTLRPMIWDRLQAVANNHGLTQIWTQETAPFWNHCGLVRAEDAVLAKLPAAWQTTGRPWLTLKLREDIETVISADKEFAMFMESEKERTNRAFRHAKVMKTLATVLALVVLLIVVVGAIYVMTHQNRLRH